MRAEGGSSSAKLAGLFRQPHAGRRIFVRRFVFGPRAAHAPAANGVPMVNRLYADCADDEPLLGQLCLIWLKVAIYVSCVHIICIQCNPETLNPIP